MSADIPAIGALRDRVRLFHKDMMAEPEGGNQSVYMPLATVWARVHTRPAGRSEFADARGTATTHTVVMRFRTDLAAGDRITCRGRVLDVLSVEDLNGKRAFITCACAETTVTA